MKNTFKPILFSTPMVQAILQGTKTQTRRIIKIDTGQLIADLVEQTAPNYFSFKKDGEFIAGRKSKYQVGDILWVRETWKISPQQCTWQKYSYKADYHSALSELGKWKPSIHMPKAAARIFLKVTNVRVERLQDISEADAVAEGIEKQKTNYGDYLFKHYLKDKFGPSAKHSFQTLWQKIYGIESWDKNPYVWVYEYERIEKPKDFI